MNMKEYHSSMAFSIILGLMLLCNTNGEDLIQTYAGTSHSGCPYIGAPADGLSFGLAHIFDIDFDVHTGTAYYAVFGCSVIVAHNRITNIASTFVGSPGTGGYSGDHGFANQSQIGQPTAVKVDPDSRYLYIGGDSRIRRVDLRTQIITTVAGNGELYAENSANGDGGLAINAPFGAMYGFAFNTSRYLFTADAMTRIRRLDLESGIVTNYAGSLSVVGLGDGYLDSAVFQTPTSIWGDGSFLYVFDAGTCAFRSINMQSGWVSTIGGQPGVCVSGGDGGSFALATIHSDVKICGKDKAGNFYFADQSQDMSRSTIGGCSIRKVSPDGIVTKYAGTNCYVGGYNGEDIPATDANLYLYHGGCTIYEDQVYLTDNDPNGSARVRFVFSNGTDAPSMSPSAVPTVLSPGNGTVTAPPTPAACYWSGEVDGCEGGLEEVVVESSSSSAGYVNDQYVINKTTITKVYKKRV